MSAAAAPAARDRFPPQVRWIMASEGAERFSFYGMRNVLVIYMVQFLLVSAADAKASYHYFVMANYLMPLVGGWLADRFLGRYRVILFLSFGYVIGHAVVAAVETRMGLLAGCALIAIGAGGIKPCVSAYVGDQFAADQKHLLAKVYGLFYWMVNLGSVTASLLIPWLLKAYGPAVAFGVPGVLMALALVFFVAGRRQYVNVPPTGPNPHSFVKVVATALARRGARAPGRRLAGARAGGAPGRGGGRGPGGAPHLGGLRHGGRLLGALRPEGGGLHPPGEADEPRRGDLRPPGDEAGRVPAGRVADERGEPVPGADDHPALPGQWSTRGSFDWA